MKLWLDDERPAPPGWHHATSALEALGLIRFENVEVVSLDHDLGDEPWNGYWLLNTIERDIVSGVRYPLPRFEVHTANPVGRANMLRAIQAIERLQERLSALA